MPTWQPPTWSAPTSMARLLPVWYGIIQSAQTAQTAPATAAPAWGTEAASNGTAASGAQVSQLSTQPPPLACVDERATSCADDPVPPGVAANCHARCAVEPSV